MSERMPNSASSIITRAGSALSSPDDALPGPDHTLKNIFFCTGSAVLNKRLSSFTIGFAFRGSTA